MRWFWIDRFTQFESRKSATAIKAVTMTEEHLHDLYPDYPVVPHSLIVEGMAQTSGLLVGEAKDFAEKVVLAKVGKAVFHRLVQPGDTLIFSAVVEQLNDIGASISGQVMVEGVLVAEIELMFSHIDQNLSGAKFPEHNFVFTQQFKDLVLKFEPERKDREFDL